MKLRNLSSKLAIASLSVLAGAVLFTSASGNSALATYEAPDPVLGNYFTTDFDTKQDAWNNADAVNEEICEEGFTVLKNEDNCMPLPKNAKISVFGKTSVDMLYGLSSNYVHLRLQNAPMTTLEQSLTGAGFAVNPNLINFYNNNTLSGSGRGSQPTNGANVKGFHTGETPVANYSGVDGLEDSYETYNDAALIVISRSSGEGWDLPKTMTWNGSSYTSGGTSEKVDGARNKDDHYLQLDQNESDLMKYVGERFNKVIVIFNTPTTFETGFLDDPGHYGYHENLKGAIWVGYSGRTGLKALGKILCGDVNPSGRTTDTWSRDYKNDPTWGNFGVFGINGGGVYVMYKEGIYVGYRYFETRGFEEGNNAYTGTIHGSTTTNWDSWYQSAVCYPFGYGLSYTTFKEEIVGTSKTAGSNITATDELTIQVKVTNTGDRAGKRTSMIYYTAPYTTGGIEKPYVVLAGFDKTKLLEPQEFEILNIKIKVRDLASYDYADLNHNSFKGYELEAGTYSIKLMSDSHTLIDKVDYVVASNERVETSDTTNYKIENQFDDVSNLLTNSTADGGLNEVYLSRADFAGTFPKNAVAINFNTAYRNQYNEYKSVTVDDSTRKYYVESADIHFGNDTGDIKLCDLFQADYNDPLWDDFLDQLSEDTMKYLVSEGGYRSGKDISALGMIRAINAGQPAGYMSLFSGMEGAQYAFFSSDCVTAATYNEDLAYKKGNAIGNEALFGTGKKGSKFPGWYAPAADTHRSPFGGRCADYFSEDGLVGGKLAAKIIEGATEKGVFTFFKHFALNEQENNRVQITTWASEQSMREIYLKPFEIAVKEGHTMCIMSALNRIGSVWSGGHYGLLQEVLRNEWGFNGCVVTDSYIGGFSMLDQMIKNGGDLALGSASGERSKLGSASSGTMTPTTYVALRNSVHHILYPMANSMAINVGTPGKPEVFEGEFEGGELPVALVDTSYSKDLGTLTFNADAFVGTTVPDNSLIKYSLKEGSTLPQGLTLSEDGILSGTPREEVISHPFTVVGSYDKYSKEATFSITVSNINGSIIYQNDHVTKTLYLNEAVSDYSVATASIVKVGATQEEIDNFPKVTYSLEPGSFMPYGLTMSKLGVITGTPTREALNYEFTVIASALGFRDVKTTFKLEIVNKVAFEGKQLVDGKLQTPYLEKIAAESDEKMTYEIKQGDQLPAGLTLTKGGYITGTPRSTVKDQEFTIIAKGDFCETKEATFKLTIGIKYNYVEAPRAYVGEDYVLNVANAQGADDITYSIKDGESAPLYMTLSNDGKLTGKFKNSGVVYITVVAKSRSLGTTDSLRIAILVDER